MISLSESYDFR